MVYIDMPYSKWCTGWVYDNNTIATAGHCVFGDDDDADTDREWRWPDAIIPARNGSNWPYGTCQATNLYTVSGWTNGGAPGDPEYDYGAIKLDCNIGNTVGTLGYFWTAQSLTGTDAAVGGYPDDKAAGTMWWHEDDVHRTETRRVFYETDTAGGQSGSAVFDDHRGSCGHCALAIHSGGSGSQNWGVRITETVFNNLQNWGAS